MGYLKPFFKGERFLVAQLLPYQFNGVNPIGPAPDTFPVLQGFVEMDRNLVATGSAVVDDALFQDSVRMIQHVAAEFRRHDASLPAKVNIRNIDARSAFVRVHGKDAFVEIAFKAFEFREDFSDFFGLLFH